MRPSQRPMRRSRPSLSRSARDWNANGPASSGGSPTTRSWNRANTRSACFHENTSSGCLAGSYVFPATPSPTTGRRVEEALTYRDAGAIAALRGPRVEVTAETASEHGVRHGRATEERSAIPGARASAWGDSACHRQRRRSQVSLRSLAGRESGACLREFSCLARRAELRARESAARQARLAVAGACSSAGSRRLVSRSNNSRRLRRRTGHAARASLRRLRAVAALHCRANAPQSPGGGRLCTHRSTQRISRRRLERSGRPAAHGSQRKRHTGQAFADTGAATLASRPTAQDPTLAASGARRAAARLSPSNAGHLGSDRPLRGLLAVARESPGTRRVDRRHPRPRRLGRARARRPTSSAMR